MIQVQVIIISELGSFLCVFALSSSVVHIMSLLANVVGFSLVGLAARFGQLGIQKQNLFMSVYLFRILFMAKISLILAVDPGGHLLSMGVFGYAGYWAYKWDIRSRELLEEKRQEILERRQKQMQKIEYLQI